MDTFIWIGIILFVAACSVLVTLTLTYPMRRGTPMLRERYVKAIGGFIAFLIILIFIVLPIYMLIKI